MPGLGEEQFLEALQAVGAGLAALPTQLLTKEGETDPVRTASSVTAASIFRHPDAHPIALNMLLLRQYGPEWML